MTHKYSISKYERHFDLPGIGIEGQERLRDAKVCIIGLGGLGSPVAIYLSAAGVGNITLIDDDTVSTTNLQRQILFREVDVGTSKTESAERTLTGINSETKYHFSNVKINEDNAELIISGSDIVLDCTDNFDTRYLINSACMRLNKTLVSGSVIYFDGQVAVFKNGTGCYSCLYPIKPDAIQVPTCTESAVLGPVVGVIGTLMAVEAIKEICKIGESLAGSFISYSALNSELMKVKFTSKNECKICSYE